ncbi:putative ankyrin repeat-containing protein [Clavispora lusitaniae]|uniref:Uncharacterized protein n=2 Tax=Clavispora lusitaniae TaxID=36911 RepID=C4YC18_CLAL4|nr:uncharacterized protein CLUG_05835 [Clavispora lusitaniae ATCC 42720]KAF5208671.1 hypothetical protein E0198_005177 [Clavispora lusitaniae]EEQ41707.1 hypothetical protein CLUG_05835 [Clavispora lusitaniae ATCC 42720]KAF7580512.1 Ankyrin repeats (many copies) family protein [Clavispora lusitaniae]QFZ30386.1 putative ankyrin repeat-containing protein [Clavispora lusitaniae]QFZ36048.1 putative ankyrin repeat-containing protein [Clavispora lusitaniae]
MVSNIWVAAADNESQVVLEHIRSGNFSANSKDPNGYTPLHAAASYGHRDLLKLLVENGGDINIQDNEGDTPLHHTEDVATATFMVEQLGANHKIKNAEGQTPADFVQEEDEFPELAQYLRSLAHDAPAESAVLDSLPSPGIVDGHQIRYTMEDDQGEMDEERRKKLEAIVNSENPEEALRDLVTSAVREGLANYKDENDQPKRKK